MRYIIFVCVLLIAACASEQNYPAHGKGGGMASTGRPAFVPLP